MMVLARIGHQDAPLLRAQGSAAPPARGGAHPTRNRLRRDLRPPRRESSGWAPYIVGGVLAAMALIISVAVFGAGGGTTTIAPHRTASGPIPQGTQTFVEAGRSHVQGTVTYDRTPPAGGDHAPVWLNCGIYTDPVPNENAVHSLEHGAVWITYQPSLPDDQVAALRGAVSSRYDGPGRYVILSPYPGQPAPIVATAWGNQLQLESSSDSRLGKFIDHFREGSQDLEPGASCTQGVGTPSGS